MKQITNNDYFGEIAQMGDSVRIIKEPEITVKAYERGTITPQDLDDERLQPDHHKANYFAFKVDDIREAHSHVNFQSLASDRAAYHNLPTSLTKTFLATCRASSSLLCTQMQTPLTTL